MIFDYTNYEESRSADELISLAFAQAIKYKYVVIHSGYRHVHPCWCDEDAEQDMKHQTFKILTMCETLEEAEQFITNWVNDPSHNSRPRGVLSITKLVNAIKVSEVEKETI